jgi:hypothetical protein
MGQITYAPGAPFARLAFLAPNVALRSPSLTDLVEQLAFLAGELGAFNLLAEIDEHAAAIEVLRETGFGVYARQRIWRLKTTANLAKPEIPWRAAASQDVFAAQALYHNLVPGLVQQVEPLSKKLIHGLVCENNGQLIGYANLKSGSHGIWAQPFIHPDVEPVDARLGDMLKSIPDQRSRALYICVRSYQSWLENSLTTFGAEPGPMQAVLVKRLAVQHKAKRPFTLPAVEGQPEISAPIAHSKSVYFGQIRENGNP